jgi:tetratricopeptide (TPR) repeat protein
MKFTSAIGTLLCLSTGIVRAGNIVVLPFSNASNSPNLDWVGESVSETVREVLAKQGLIALNRDDRGEAYRRLGLRSNATPTRATIIKIGQSLDADQVVYGEFEFVPPPSGVTATRGSLRLKAHVLDLGRVRQGPEFLETGALEDLAALQAHLAWQVLQLLAPNQAPSETEFRAQWPQVRVDAIENYIRGLLAVAPEQKVKLFTQALRLDPNFSDPAYQLGMLAYTRKEYKAAGDWLQKVLQSDVHSRPATFYFGICRFNTGDFSAARNAFERVASEVPLNEVFNNLGAAQSRLNSSVALDSFGKALEGDSGDPVYHFNVGYALWKQGRFGEAAERFRAALDRDPRDQEATIMLGKCLKKTGPRPGDPRGEGLERLKTNYEESAYWQLKALLRAEKP